MKTRFACSFFFCVLLAFPAFSQDAPPKQAAKKKKPPKQVDLEAIQTIAPALSLGEAGHQIDFPFPAENSAGEVFVAYLDHDGTSDSLRIVQKGEGG